MESPEFILPTHTIHDKNSILLTFESIEKDLLNAAEADDLTLICLNFELPDFGKFTKYEWLNFGLIHTQRHIHQLKNIFQKLTVK